MFEGSFSAATIKCTTAVGSQSAVSGRSSSNNNSYAGRSRLDFSKLYLEYEDEDVPEEREEGIGELDQKDDTGVTEKVQTHPENLSGRNLKFQVWI